MPLPLLSYDSATMVLICSPGGSKILVRWVNDGGKNAV
jgi:hypothetical protein